MVALFILASGCEVYSSLFSCCCFCLGGNKFSIKFAGKMFKPTSSSISLTEIILVSNKVNVNKRRIQKKMFGCGPKYFSERLKLERVYKTYALRMANELHKSSSKCSKQFVTL